VLDVPEFAPLLLAARRLATCQVHAPRAGYVLVEFDGEIELNRSDTGMTEAVWFGCLTGGLDGSILSFNETHLTLAPAARP
jgi:hypothetical protein